MNLSQIDLNLLVVLHTVLKEGSVAKAAKRLHVTSPAISNALARLRLLLADPLFVRHGRGLTPTRRALSLAPLLARTLDELEQICRPGPDFNPKTSTCELTMALADADQVATLPAVAQAFAARLPCAHLQVISVDTLIARGGLIGANVDLVISPAMAALEPDVHARSLYQERGVFIVHRDHPRVRRKLTPETFAKEHHIDVHLALGKPGIGNRVAKAAMAQQGLSRKVALTVPTFTAAVMAVATTQWVAGVPERVALAFASTLPIKIVESPLPSFTFSMHMAWHERTHHDPAAKYLRELVRATLGH